METHLHQRKHDLQFFLVSNSQSKLLLYIGTFSRIEQSFYTCTSIIRSYFLVVFLLLLLLCTCAALPNLHNNPQPNPDTLPLHEEPYERYGSSIYSTLNQPPKLNRHPSDLQKTKCNAQLFLYSDAAKGSGSSNGGRPPAASNNTQQQPKKRRVIDDDDDDDDLPAAPKPRPSPAGGSSRGGGGVVGGKTTSGMNGSASSHSGDRQHSEKRKIVAGPPSSGRGAGAKAGESSSNPASTSRKGNVDDDDDMPLGAILKKQSKAPGASRNSTIPNKIPSKNGLKSSGSKSFTIPKREGMSPSPHSSGGKKMAGSSSSSPRPAGMGNKRPASGSSRRDNDDDDFEQKPVKLKKRPEDFTRDPHSKSAQKRKLEEQRIKEEAARKKKQRNNQGSSSKVKVKADPGRRGSSSVSRSSSAGKKSQRAKAKAKKEKQVPKKTTRAERIEQAMKVYKWWEEPAHEDGRRWESLEHNGAHFAPEYKPHNVKLKYDGKDVYLTPQQEEVATFYASVS